MGKENVAQDVAALVSGARQLQPLLAKAERLRRAAKDAPRRREEVDGMRPLQIPYLVAVLLQTKVATIPALNCVCFCLMACVCSGHIAVRA